MLLTRSPLDPKAPFDLHVLSPPLAFALSQDQTLRFESENSMESNRSCYLFFKDRTEKLSQPVSGTLSGASRCGTRSRRSLCFLSEAPRAVKLFFRAGRDLLARVLRAGFTHRSRGVGPAAAGQVALPGDGALLTAR